MFMAVSQTRNLLSWGFMVFLPEEGDVNSLRKLVLSILLALIPAVAIAGDCGVANLFFYEAEYDCSISTPVNEPVTFDVVLETWHLPDAIAEISFAVPGWIGNPGEPFGWAIENWSADQVSGDLASGVSLRWSDGLAPAESDHLSRLFHLGTIEVTSLDPAWPGAVSVPLENVVYYDTDGGDFETFATTMGVPTECHFNLDDECWGVIVDPPDTWYWRELRYLLPPDNSQVSGLIPLSFEVENWDCWLSFGFPYAGRVTLDGELIEEFEDDGEGNHLTDIDVSGIPNETIVEVEVFVDYGMGHTDSVIRHYLVLWTPVEETSFSNVRSRY